MGRWQERDEEPIRVVPVCATYWPRADRPTLKTVGWPVTPSDRKALAAAVERKNTVWIETKLDEMTEKQRQWLEGEFDVWRELPTPEIDWTPTSDLLDLVHLEPPGVNRGADDSAEARLLRSLPFAYTRGTFGTIRDAFDDERIGSGLSGAARGDPVTVFPTTGFIPFDGRIEDQDDWYTVLHATVAVVGRIVISIRLPDRFCPERPERSIRYLEQLIPSNVLMRFLPLRRMASGREVAEAIGMHQATTARAVAGQIRTRLKEAEVKAAALDADDSKATGGSRGRSAVRQNEAKEATRKVDRLAEIAQLLNRDLATILRRIGGKVPDAGPEVRELAPREVKRRYRFALDNVHTLQEDCRLAAQIVRQSISTYEQSQREHFQFIAALLASIVLVPTLIAGVFGTNLQVPAQDDPAGFPIFLATIAGLAAIGYLTVRTARRHDWQPPREQLWLAMLAALAIVAAFAVYLVIWGSDKSDGARHTTNFPSSCMTSPSTISLPPSLRSQTRSVCTADSLTPPDSG